MKKSIALLFLTALAVGTAARAQEQVTLAGRVIDAETGRPLSGASVLVLDSDVATSTDAAGGFSIRVATDGEITLQVRFIGYVTASKTVHAMIADLVPMDFALQPTILPGQTIVVTATRGTERETPATFSTLKVEDIVRRYSTQDIPQLLSDLPSTTWYSENGNGIGYNYLNIRGFDQRRISVMVNGIPQNDPEDHNVYWLDFPDLAASTADMQVQRGGGTAFFGPPAIGGSVNLITTTFNRPSGIEVIMGGGSFNTRKYSIAAHSGLVDDRYAFSGRLSRITSDGYRERSWTKFWSYYVSAVRYGDRTTIQANLYGGPITDHLAYYGIPKEDAYSHDETKRRQNPIVREEEVEQFSQPHYELLHEWQINDRVTLNNTLFLVTGDGYFDYDGSWAPFSYYRITPEYGFTLSGDPEELYSPNALIRAYVSNRQWGWLPRIRWEHHGGALTAGLEFRVHRSLHWGALRMGDGLPQGVVPDRRYYEYRGGKEIVSLHVQELAEISEQMRLLVGLQLVFNRYRLYDEQFLGTDFRMPYRFLNPKVGLNYNLSASWNLYAQFAYTSREPRLKNLYDAAEASTPANWGAVVPQFELLPDGSFDFSRPLVTPEHLSSIELGIGYTGDRLRWTVNTYLMNVRDEIVKNGKLDRFGQPVTGNAERTRHVGIELVANVHMTSTLSIDGNATMSRNRFVRFTSYEDGNALVLDGNSIAGFPDFLANLRVTYVTDLLSTGLGLQHVGEFYTDNMQDPNDERVLNDRTVDARSILSFWLEYAIPAEALGATVAFQLQIQNLLNRRYAMSGEADHFFPGATRNLFASVRVNM